MQSNGILWRGSEAFAKPTQGKVTLKPFWSKAAQGCLVKSMVQDYKPWKIHVVSVLIDGPIDAPGMRDCSFGAKLYARELEAPGSKLLNPAEVSAEFVRLAEQHPLELAGNLLAVKPGELFAK